MVTLRLQKHAPAFARQIHVGADKEESRDQILRLEQVCEGFEVELTGLNEPVNQTDRKDDFQGLKEEIFGFFMHGCRLSELGSDLPVLSSMTI